MGIVMKKLVLLATALAMVSGTAFAADMPLKAMKAPPPAPFDPWDIAFGGGITNDYIFRGITQSNHKPSVNAYFEPRYNVTKDFQLYVGLGAASISFPNRAAAEVDAYGGARLTVGAFAFDVGAWGYIYPGGTCQYGGGAVADFACLDAMAKYLGTHMDTLQVVGVRYASAFLLTLLISNPILRPGLLRTQKPSLQLGRSLLLLGSTVFNFMAFRYLRAHKIIYFSITGVTTRT